MLTLGIAAVLLLVYGLAAPNLPALVGALAGSAASWSLSAWTRGSGAPGGTIIVATAIFVAAELSYWSLEQASVPDEPELLAWRAAGLGLRAVGALALVSFALAALSGHAEFKLHFVESHAGSHVACDFSVGDSATYANDHGGESGCWLAV